MAQLEEIFDSMGIQHTLFPNILKHLLVVDQMAWKRRGKILTTMEGVLIALEWWFLEAVQQFAFLDFYKKAPSHCWHFVVKLPVMFGSRGILANLFSLHPPSFDTYLNNAEALKCSYAAVFNSVRKCQKKNISWKLWAQLEQQRQVKHSHIHTSIQPYYRFTKLCKMVVFILDACLVFRSLYERDNSFPIYHRQHSTLRPRLLCPLLTILHWLYLLETLSEFLAPAVDFLALIQVDRTDPKAARWRR